jgi:cytochrome c2
MVIRRVAVARLCRLAAPRRWLAALIGAADELAALLCRRQWQSAQQPVRATALRRRRPAVRHVILGALLCASFSHQTRAQIVAHNAELAQGEHIAQLICSACHVVAKDQEFPPILTKPAPSFFDIANRPGVSAESLQHFITHTHWDTDELPMTMPNPMLTPGQTRAVSRYILSLRSH